MNKNKSVFISYCHKDEDIAQIIALELQEKIGTDVWIDLFDLDAGDEFALKIAGAIQKANWFILLASESSYKSRWVKFEANLATFQSIEKEDFKIITIKIDNSQIPDPLRIILETRIYFEAKEGIDKVIDKLIAMIAKEASTRSGLRHIFFNRGNEIDNLQLAVDKVNIIFLLGIYGIGKSTLIEEVAKNRLGRPFIKISIRKGHDLEQLSRQMLAQTDTIQPPKDIDSNDLLELSVKNIIEKQKQDNSLLILDDLENSIDEEGNIRAYILEYLRKYLENSSRFPLILISTRKPELPFDILDKCYFLLLEKLADEYICSLIQHWYRSSKGDSVNLDLIDINRIAKMLGGHPLAAKFIASYLILNSPGIILKSNFLYEFKLRIAEHILRDILGGLNQVDKIILQVIAVAELGISIEDLMEATLLKQYNIENIQKTINKLTNAMLISQEADVLKLHSFIQEYFLRDAESSKNIKLIAHDIGNKMYVKLNSLTRTMGSFNKETDLKTITYYNKKVFQYAVTSHRLLLFSGQHEKAGKIPFNLQGHIRELVLISYRRFKDYEQSLEYANKWLEIESSDSEIELFKARSLRRLERYSEAEQVLQKLSNIQDRYLKAKVEREKGLIAKDNNKISAAVKHFRNASVRNFNGNPIYPIALADLANVLIIEAENMKNGNMDEKIIKSNYEEAVKLLIEAKDYMPRFDDVHLLYHIEALINLGKSSEAEEKLENALRQYPDDPHFLLKKANILASDPGRWKIALECADKALDRNLDWACFVKAKILYNIKNYDEALKYIEFYKPKNPRDNIYVIELKCRILIAKDCFDEVRKYLKNENIQNNSYIDYVQMKNEIANAEKMVNMQNYNEAKQIITTARNIFESKKEKYLNNPPVQQLGEEIQRLLNKIQSMIK